MRNRLWLLCALVCVPVLLAVLAVCGWKSYLSASGPLQQPVAVVVNPGDSPPLIARKLAESGVIRHPEAFILAVRLGGQSAGLKAGEYLFEPGIPLRLAIAKLAEGDTENRTLTIPEGYTVAQVIRVLEGTETLTGSATAVAEGALFPDTYQFRFGTSRRAILGTMEERMKTELEAAWSARSPGLPYHTPDDLLIMASIVQKEAATEEEMPRIAAVFVNRLRQDMKLQADPTVIYGANYVQGTKLLKKDLTEPHPFNTYVFKGLPPTAIANPGKAALMAAAQPAPEKYLYFVADPSRTHHVFSSSYAEHRKNVSRYWQLVGKGQAPAVISPTSGPGKP